MVGGLKNRLIPERKCPPDPRGRGRNHNTHNTR